MKPWRILAVTFTNKAAREMTERVEKLLGIPAEGLWIGTFHGICVRILRREAQRWGFRRDFTIYDRDDQLAAVRKAMREFGIRKDRLNPNHVLTIIGRAKSDFVDAEELEKRLHGPDAPLIRDVYRRYGELLKAAGAFDFDDLLVKPVEMFRAHPESLADWQRRFSHILVDEYQDTNRTQYLLVRLLSGDSPHVTVVGDDDQSIYSWRGANVKNILGFESDFKNVKTYRLEQNYRSTRTILAAANAVVANNRNRMRKKLWTDGPAGDKVRLYECLSDMDEAERVIASIEKERETRGRRLSDAVILYRTNAQSRPFEDVLRRRGLPYVIVGGLRFYERKEIKDILAYLRIVANPDDAVSFTRAVTTPKRGIGDRTIEKLEALAKEKGVDLIAAAGLARETIGGAAGNKLREFHDVIAPLVEMRWDAGLAELGTALVEAIGYERHLEEEFPENHEDRMNNVRELVTAMGEFENLAETDNLSAFLAEVSLMADVDAWSGDSDVVTLMTLHSAKGLEFPSVYIVGVEKGLFPLPQSFESDGELEEERRLFYVGITRARERLHVSYAVSRMRFGSHSGGASLFVAELPEDLLDFESSDRYAVRSGPVRNQPVTRTMEFEDYSQETPDDGESSPFPIGMYVRHPKFGRGKVTACSGSGEKTVLTISFAGTVKNIMPAYVRLVPA